MTAAEIHEKLLARGFNVVSVSVSLETSRVERVDLEGEKDDSPRVAEAFKAAQEIEITPSRPAPSLMDALALRASGVQISAELAADVEAVLAKAGAEAATRLDVPASSPIDFEAIADASLTGEDLP